MLYYCSLLLVFYVASKVLIKLIMCDFLAGGQQQVSRARSLCPYMFPFNDGERLELKAVACFLRQLLPIKYLMI